MGDAKSDHKLFCQKRGLEVTFLFRHLSYSFPHSLSVSPQQVASVATGETRKSRWKM